MKKIVLASTSPRRKELLNAIGLKFTVIGSNFEEKLNPRLKPKNQAAYLSEGKAKTVAAKYSKDKKAIDRLIIAADTIVVIDDQVIGKPVDEKDAIRILKKLNGRMHIVVTGFTLYDVLSNKSITKSVETKVYFKKMTEGEIKTYVKTKEPMDAAGGYKMQYRGSLFVEKIEGDYFNIIGLPLVSVVEELKKFAITIL